MHSALPAQVPGPKPLPKFDGCNFNGQKETDEVTYADVPNAQYRRHLDRILRQVGLEPTKVDFQQANIDNAAAAIIEGRLTILYNPMFFDSIELATKTKWAVYGVLAHEVGHLVNAQIFSEKNPEKRIKMEFEADAFAARTLRKMCATRDEAQAALRVFGKVPPSRQAQKEFYPPVSARLNHVGQRWEEEDERITAEGNDPCRMIVTKFPLVLQEKAKRSLSEGVAVRVDDEKAVIQYDVPPHKRYRTVYTRFIIRNNADKWPKTFDWEDDLSQPGKGKRLVWYYTKDGFTRPEVEKNDLYSVASWEKLPMPTPPWRLLCWGAVAAGGVGALIYGADQRDQRKYLYDDVYAKYTRPDASIYTTLNKTRSQVKLEADQCYTRERLYTAGGAMVIVGSVAMIIWKWNKKHAYALVPERIGSTTGIGLKARF